MKAVLYCCANRRKAMALSCSWICTQRSDPLGKTRRSRPFADSYRELIAAGDTQYRPDQADTWMNLGTALSDMGKLPDAVAQYERALQSYSELI